MDNVDVLIVGGGPAGISAVLWCKRLELNHLLLEANKKIGGQMSQIHNKIIDYPGIMAANGEEMQQLFERQLSVLSCNVKLNSSISSINLKENIVVYKDEDVETIVFFKYIIFAAGSYQKLLNVPGEKEMLERGEIYSATKDREKLHGKTVAVIGGGDRAFEGAFLLAEAGANVFLIHRSTHFKARKAYQERVFANKTIRLLTNTTVSAIEGENNVEEITIKQDGVYTTLKADAVIVRIGVTPNSDLVYGEVNTDSDGYIIVNQYGQSSVPSFFAVGDVCTRPAYSSLSTSVGQGMIAAKYIAQLLHTQEGPIYY